MPVKINGDVALMKGIGKYLLEKKNKGLHQFDDDFINNKTNNFNQYIESLEKEGFVKDAEVQLKHIDLNYSNYPERLEFSKFLIRQQKNQEAIELLNQLLSESKNMTDQNKRIHKQTIYEVANTLRKIS